MSRHLVILVIAGYAVAALTFGVFVEMQKPFATLAGLANEYELGAILGIALPAFVLPGIIALIIWAFMRFRAERAKGPLITWLTLLAVYCAFMGYGAIYGKQKRAAAEALPSFEVISRCFWVYGSILQAGRDFSKPEARPVRARQSWLDCWIHASKPVESKFQECV
jgi:glucan phosphoethanolaminetransferase (alkaline phosphatase superfamily)